MTTTAVTSTGSVWHCFDCSLLAEQLNKLQLDFHEICRIDAPRIMEELIEF